MFKKALIASAMLVSVIGANAASSAPLVVSGTATPGACNVTLGGSVDFGALNIPQIKTLGVVAGVAYSVATKSTTVSVACGAATKAELSFSDNKSSTKLVIDGNDYARYGITDGAGTTGIGSYHVNLSTVLIDSAAPAGVLVAPTGTTTWASMSTAAIYGYPGYSMGFTKVAANTVPDTFTTLTANINVALWLSKSYTDAATNLITINGGSVLTMQYL